MLDFYCNAGLALLFFAVFNLLPGLGAWCCARRLMPEGGTGRYAVMLAIWMLQGIAITGVLGWLGWLDIASGLIAGGITGGALCLAGGKPRPEAKRIVFLSGPERLLASLLAVNFLLSLYYVTLNQLGTDSHLYHLFYPAVWLRDGAFSAVPLAGYACEYYPFYGELLYGFLMLPLGDAGLAFVLQPLALLMAALALGAWGRMLRFSFTVRWGVMNWLIFTGMIAENALVAYTDVLTGALLLTGTALLLIALERRRPGLEVLAGLLFGTCAATKYTGLIWAPAVMLAILLLAAWKRRPAPLLLRSAAAAVIAASPPYLCNFLITGNPIYPVRVAVGSVTIFKNHLAMSLPRISGWRQLYDFCFGSPLWGLNFTSAALAAAALAAMAAGAAGWYRRRLSWAIFPLLAALTLALTVFQLMIYPVCGNCRQLIPPLMLALALALPVLGRIERRLPPKHREWLLVAIVLSGCLALRFTIWRSWWHFWRAIGVFALLPACCRGPWFSRALWALAVFFIGVIPFNFGVRIAQYELNLAMNVGGGRVPLFRHVDETAARLRRPLVIAAVGNNYNYLLMANHPRNRVIYVPVSAIDSPHVHDFGSFAAMRDAPVDYPVWRERLRQRKVDFLLVQTNSVTGGFRLANDGLERRWAEAHPEDFRRVFADPEMALYRVAGP